MSQPEVAGEQGNRNTPENVDTEEIPADPVHKKPGMSQKLQSMLEKMYESVDDHVDVFPPPPKPGNIAIPLGGLAKCICSPTCKKLLPQPAYRIVSVLEHRWWLKKEKEDLTKKRRKK